MFHVECMSAQENDHDALLRRLLRERIHVERRALVESPPAVRQRFAHAWAPAERLLTLLGPWPSGLITHWLAAPAGHVVLAADASAYQPDTYPWQGGELRGVARVALSDLLDDAAPALRVVAELVDHLLGSDAQGRRLSDGAGANPELEEVADRLLALAFLGYGPAAPHAYFAWAFSLYWIDRRALNVADPNIERLLRTTVCDERFWAQ